MIVRNPVSDKELFARVKVPDQLPRLVSIDGPREMHDAYRVDKGGKPTFDRVIAGPERKSRIISDAEKTIIAYHEGGHAVCAYVLEHADPRAHPMTQAWVWAVYCAMGIDYPDILDLQIREGHRLSRHDRRHLLLSNMQYLYIAIPPLLILVVLAIGVVTFIMVAVVPGIKDMISSSGAPVPESAKMVLNASDWLIANGVADVKSLIGALET